MLNKRWRQRIIDTEYINERAITTTILVNRQHIKLMSVYFSHSKCGEALKSCNVDHEYVSLLRKIYRDQKASVQIDEESNILEIRKGTKQGDPMFSLLFNTVLQSSLKDEIQRWQKKKGMGIYLSDHDRDGLTNLRLADDVMLFASSKEQIRKMMCEFKKATEKVGLRIHLDKTKILSNQSTINSDTKNILKSVT